jgi:hypothetical protein
MPKRTRVHVELLPGVEGGVAPIVALFPSGEPLGTELEFECHSNTLERKAHQRIVVARGPESGAMGVAYKGRNFGAENPTPQLSRNMLGVYDRTTGVVRLVEIDHIYSMRQTLAGADEDEDGPELEYRTKKNLLINAFGSKRRRKSQKALASNEISSDRMGSFSRVEKAIDRSAAASAATAAPADASGTAEALLEARRLFLPQFDLEAESQEKVYDMMAAIPKEVRTALLPDAKEYINLLKDPVKLAARVDGSDGERRLHLATARRLGRLTDRDAKARKRGALLIVYEKLLMRMHRMGRVLSGDRVDVFAAEEEEEEGVEKPTLRGAAEVLAGKLGVDAVVMQHLLDTFAEEDGAARQEAGLESGDESGDEDDEAPASRCVALRACCLRV